MTNSGDWSVSLEKTNDALEQDVANLQKGATYKVSVWAKNTNPSGITAYLCLKYYGGNEKKVLIDSAEYRKYEVEFVYTGDTSGKNTRSAIWIERATSGNIYIDDWSFEIASNLKSFSVDNGSLKAEYKEGYTGEMKSSDFDISYTSSEVLLHNSEDSGGIPLQAGTNPVPLPHSIPDTGRSPVP